MNIPNLTKPYKVGDKIKIYVGKDDNEHTFGVVYYVSVNNRPMLRYKDMSDLPLEKFNRFVGMADVDWRNEPKMFRRK